MYYKIELQAGTKETGPKYPQLHCLTQKEAFSLKKIKESDEIPSLEFRLEKRAKITDVLSEGSIATPGLLINQKTLSIINRFRLQKHLLVPAKVFNGDTILEYVWFQFVSNDLLDLIDFPNSVFYREDGGFRTGDTFQLKSYQDFDQRLKEVRPISIIQAEQVVFKPSFQHNLDFFSIPTIDYGVYASSLLINELKSEKITGIEIAEAKNIAGSS